MYLYENRAMEPVEVILSGERRENDGGMNLYQDKAIWRCDSEALLQPIYANKMFK
jgi:hypothetical protein